MLNSGKKNSAIKKMNILTLELSEKKILSERKKPSPPPCKLNGRSLTSFNKLGIEFDEQSANEKL